MYTPGSNTARKIGVWDYIEFPQDGERGTVGNKIRDVIYAIL